MVLSRGKFKLSRKLSRSWQVSCSSGSVRLCRSGGKWVGFRCFVPLDNRTICWLCPGHAMNTWEKEANTVFELVLLQTLEQVWSKLRPKDLHHLLAAHLAEGGAVHGAVGQAERAGVVLGQLHLVADPVQDIGCGPALGTDVAVRLACTNPEAGLSRRFRQLAQHFVLLQFSAFYRKLHKQFGKNSLSFSVLLFAGWFLSSKKDIYSVCYRIFWLEYIWDKDRAVPPQLHSSVQRFCWVKHWLPGNWMRSK